MLIKQLAIIGTGLIGGSLASSLKKAQLVEHIVGYDQCTHNLDQALSQGIIDSNAKNIQQAVTHADVIVLATPLSTMQHILTEIYQAMQPHAVITDVGSSKALVIEQARKILGKRISQFIPTHPIAGKEHSGIAAASDHLFANQYIILTPLPETDPQAQQIIEKMWQGIGAKITQLDASHHDQVLAITSHLPHMLAYALVDYLSNMDESMEIFEYAAGGFADFTRIASSDPKMWHDICLANQQQLSQALHDFITRLEKINHAINKADSQALLDIFNNAKQQRDSFIDSRTHKKH